MGRDFRYDKRGRDIIFTFAGLAAEESEACGC